MTDAIITLDLAGIASLCAEARRLIAGGMDPATLVHAYRGATLCFYPVPLWRWAALTTEERADRSIRFVKYRPRNAPQGDGYASHTAKSLSDDPEGRA